MRLIRARQAVAGVYLPLAGGTMTGDIQMDANLIAFMDVAFRRDGAGLISLVDYPPTAFQTWRLGIVLFDQYLAAIANGARIQTGNTDNWYLAGMARDSGVGLVETDRRQGAADPYFQATLPLRLNPIATAALPATPVEGMVTYDATTNHLVMYNGAAWVPVPDAFAAGTVLLASADTEGNSPPVAATKKKEIIVPTSGTLSVSFDVVSKDATHGIYAQVYRNGVAQGAEYEETTYAYVTVTVTVAGWESGDLCQLYVRYKTATDVGSKWRNFRIRAAVDIHNFITNLDT